MFKEIAGNNFASLAYASCFLTVQVFFSDLQNRALNCVFEMDCNLRVFSQRGISSMQEMSYVASSCHPRGRPFLL